MSYSLRNIIIGYIAVLAVVLLILFIIYSTLISQEQEQDKISKSRIALQKLQPAIANVQEIRIISSNYQLTPNKELLNKYQVLVKKINEDSLTMVMLATLSKESKDYYLQLAALTRKIIDESEAQMQRKEKNQGAGATNYSSEKAGAATVDQFKTIAGTLEDRNRQILNTSYGNSLSFTRRTFTYVRVILVVLISLMLVSLIFMYKDIQNRKKAEIRLKTV
jgi:CHASE3 domain sensor protein